MQQDIICFLWQFLPNVAGWKFFDKIVLFFLTWKMQFLPKNVVLLNHVFFFPLGKQNILLLELVQHWYLSLCELLRCLMGTHSPFSCMNDMSCDTPSSLLWLNPGSHIRRMYHHQKLGILNFPGGLELQIWPALLQTKQAPVSIIESFGDYFWRLSIQWEWKDAAILLRCLGLMVNQKSREYQNVLMRFSTEILLSNYSLIFVLKFLHPKHMHPFWRIVKWECGYVTWLFCG